MPAVFHRLDDSIIEILPTYPDVMSMSGKYVVDYPDHFDLKLKDSTPTKAQVVSRVNELLRDKFVSFDYFVTNNLNTSADFTNHFETDLTASISVVTNQFLPVSPANPEYNFSNSYKLGNLPNTTSVIGRFPQKDHLEGEAITSDSTLAGNRCILTQEIDISGSTNDGLGRSDFFVYFRSALKSYTKDRSLSDTERTSATHTANRKGSMAYTNTQYDSPYRLRCFISSNGSTYQEVENLKVFSFNGKVDSIRLAWVNYTDADLSLLSYTLMY
jgi:hypothetical protein